MGYDLVPTNENSKTLVLGKISEISIKIKNASLELREAKDYLESINNEFEDTPWWRFIKKKKLKNELDKAERKLVLANSEAILQIFHILGYILELILLCFFIPMDLVQKTGQWVAQGFEDRDAKMVGLIGAISVLAKDKGTKRKMLCLRGILRIIIVLILITAISFGIYKFVSHRNTVETQNQEIVINNRNE